MPSAPNTVIAALQECFSLHLTAIEHYETLSAHFSRWGYPKLAEKYAEDVKEEQEHLARLNARLEFYDVAPTCEHACPTWPRHDFEGILAANMALESNAAEAERTAVVACRAAGDELSAVAVAENLVGSEASVAEIEATYRVIEQIGLDNYLSTKV
jgi:bacterioferritin (cytochrome b1)